ncbi:MAG: hypothetical protein KBC48_00280 [Candidatus Pacebacteria bacterium]|nr:hypothetical protein [Candidatus Paceibacterota bacterium]
MRKLMVVVTMLMAFALLVSAEQFETVELEVVKGGSVGHTYFGHPEARAMGLYPYSPEYVTAWEMVNPSQNINKLQPGIYKFPVKKVEEAVTQTETKENVEDATDGGDDNIGANDERTDSGTPGPELAIGDDGFEFKGDGYAVGPERDSLETVSISPEEGRSPEQPAAAQSAAMESADTSVIVALEEKNLNLKNEVERYRKIIQSGEWIEAGVLKTQEAKIHSLTDENERLERELAESKKSKAGAIAPGNNGSYLNNSSDSFIWITIAFAIAAIVIIIISFLYARARYQVSQLQKSDRLRRESEPQNIQQQIEREIAQRMKNKVNREITLTKKVTLMRRLLAIGPHFAFYCPGATKKATKRSVGDEIFLPIQDWREDGLPLLKISGKENLVPAIPEKIVEAILSEDHQNQDDAYVLPLSYHRKRLNGKGNRNEVKPAKIHNLPKKVEARAAAQ